jgi:hypothetical protein
VKYGLSLTIVNLKMNGQPGQPRHRAAGFDQMANPVLPRICLGPRPNIGTTDIPAVGHVIAAIIKK